MKKDLDDVRKIRQSVLKSLKELSTEQINKIPAGFNNNIAWNLGHLIAAQQGICYKRSALPMKIADDFFDMYKPDTTPKQSIDDATINEIKSLLVTTLDQFEQDYDQGIFVEYPTWMSRYGVEITGIDDAVNFLKFHEGFHMGYMLALKHVI